MSVADDRPSANAQLVIAPLVGELSVGDEGADVSRYHVSVFASDWFPVLRRTYKDLSPSVPEAVG